MHLGAAGEVGHALYRPREGFGSSYASLSSAQMVDRGWTRHGHGSGDALKANDDEVEAQGNAEAHGQGLRSRRGGRGRAQWPDRARACNLHDASVITTCTGANSSFWPDQPCLVDRPCFPSLNEEIIGSRGKEEFCIWPQSKPAAKCLCCVVGTPTR